MRSQLDELSRHRGSAWDILRDQLGEVRVRLLALETRQAALQQTLRPALEQVKQQARDARAARAQGGGLQQIRAASAGGGSRPQLDEALPGAFHVAAEEQLRLRLARCEDAGQRLAQQGRGQGSVGAYGQALSVGPRQLLELLQRQNEAFMWVAASAAQVHGDTAALRAQFLRQQALAGHKGDPFELADRKEAAEARIQAQRIRSDTLKFQQQQPTPQPQPQLLQQPQPQQQSFGGAMGSLPAFGSPLGAPSASFGASQPASSGFTGFGAQAGLQKPGGMFSLDTSQPTMSAFGGGAAAAPSGSSIGKKKFSKKT